MSTNRTLVVVLSETRACELTYDSFKKNVLDELKADLCVCIGVNPNYDYTNPFYCNSTYQFLYEEPSDFGDAFEHAYQTLIKNHNLYERISNISPLISGNLLQGPKQSSENIRYYGCDPQIDIERVGDDEYVVFKNEYKNEQWRNQIYGIRKSKNMFAYQENVDTYRKRLHWREFLKIKDLMGGVCDPVHEHPGSAGILIFFRWFLLQKIVEHELLHKYDRFVITRSDFMYLLPHPKVERMDPRKIWIPDSQHCGGVTDRHVVLSAYNIESYLNIFSNMVCRSNEYFLKMAQFAHWNLESLIKFHLQQNNVLDTVVEFPYVMHAVRNINGSTRWAIGIYSEELGYYIKYESEYQKATEYKNKFIESGCNNIDDFYNQLGIYYR